MPNRSSISSSTPSCLGNPPDKTQGTNCATCPFSAECKAVKAQKCFGSFSLSSRGVCIYCYAAVECKEKTQRKIVAGAIKKTQMELVRNDAPPELSDQILKKSPVRTDNIIEKIPAADASCEKCANRPCSLVNQSGSSGCLHYLPSNIENIPAAVVEDTLEMALDFCKNPATLMRNLDETNIGSVGHVYNCGKVLRALVNGSGNLERQEKDTLFNEEEESFQTPNRVNENMIENWFNTEHCKSGKHCKSCRTSRRFRKSIRRLWKVDGLDFYCQSRGTALDDGVSSDIRESLTVEKPSNVETPPTDEAVCVNNTGMQDSFDIGVTYIFDKHEEENMLWVTDNLGSRREVLKERFKLPPEEKKEKKERITRSDSEDRDSDFADIPF